MLEIAFLLTTSLDQLLNKNSSINVEPGSTHTHTNTHTHTHTNTLTQLRIKISGAKIL